MVLNLSDNINVKNVLTINIVDFYFVRWKETSKNIWGLKDNTGIWSGESKILVNCVCF